MEAELTALIEQIEIFFGMIQLLALLLIPIVLLSLMIALTTYRKYRNPKKGKDMNE